VMLCRSRENPRRDRKRRQHIRTYSILGANPFDLKIKLKADESVKNLPSDSGGFGSQGMTNPWNISTFSRGVRSSLVAERERCCSTKRELSVISSRSATFRTSLRMEDSSCRYRKPKLRPLLCVCLGLDLVGDIGVRLVCVGGRCGEYVMMKRPIGGVIRRQNVCRITTIGS
jgi:hypothetical protein